MKYVTSFILGAMAVMVLDMVWASKGYAQDDRVYCESIMRPGVIQSFPCCYCPTGWVPA